MLLLHPVGHSTDVFIRNVDALAANHTVVAPDLPGHGFSDPIDLKGRPPQVETVAHLRRLVDALGRSRFAVLGSSYGGLLAALLCEAEQARCFGLVIVGNGSVFHADDQQRSTFRGTRDNVADGMRDPTIANCRQRIANICFSPAAVPDEILLPRATSLALPDRLPNFLATVDGLADSSPADRVLNRLEQISTPTLVITGHDDIRADVGRHKSGVSRMPNVRLSVYDQCGHLPSLEQPERLTPQSRPFLAPSPPSPRCERRRRQARRAARTPTRSAAMTRQGFLRALAAVGVSGAPRARAASPVSLNVMTVEPAQGLHALLFF